MIDKIDFHVREQILKGKDGDRFWTVLKMSIDELIIEKQIEVNNLDVQGESLFKCRVELKLLQDIASGNIIEDFISILEEKKKEQEEEIQAKIDEAKEKKK